MGLPKSLTQPLRQGQLNVGVGWRIYAAPFNRQLAVTTGGSSNGPTIYDLEVTNKFIDAAVTGPPTGWFDLGLVDKFKFTPGSKIGAITTGYRNVIRAKYRAETAEKVAFVFREMSHMAMKIATGSQIFNLLKTTVATPSSSGPLSTSGTAAVAMGASGYQPTGVVGTATSGQPTLFVPAGSGALFPARSYIVCDQDYDGAAFGFVGDSGATLFEGATTDVDYIRKTSDYVACVKQVAAGVNGQDALILTGPFVGGGNAALGTTPKTAPSAGAKVQGILGFASREGGTYIHEWSMVAVLDTLDQNQLMLYYPRISPDQFSGVDEVNLQNTSVTKEFQMNASFDALGFDDPYDGETVVRYSAFYPAPGLNIQV